MSDFVVGERLTLRELRLRHPAWTWSAQRNGYGFGYDYTGVRGSKSVSLRRYSHLLNRYDGDEGHTTVWHVDDGTGDQLYVLWCMGADRG